MKRPSLTESKRWAGSCSAGSLWKQKGKQQRTYSLCFWISADLLVCANAGDSPPWYANWRLFSSILFSCRMTLTLTLLSLWVLFLNGNWRVRKFYAYTNDKSTEIVVAHSHSTYVNTLTHTYQIMFVYASSQVYGTCLLYVTHEYNA